MPIFFYFFVYITLRKELLLMLDFVTNDKIYEIQANNQLSCILAQFDSGYIMDTIEDTLDAVINNFDTIPRPNAVLSFEQVFKELLQVYPSDKENIDICRQETYKTIISFISRKFGIMFVEQQDIDLFSIARWMYDFYVAKFSAYLIKFYTEYLVQEKDQIYASMNINAAPNNGIRDVSTIYNSMAFNTNKELAAIASCLPTILNSISGINIPDSVVYRLVYNEPAMESVIYILECSIQNTIPLFQTYNKVLFNEDTYGSVITQIRMELQKKIDIGTIAQ